MCNSTGNRNAVLLILLVAALAGGCATTDPRNPDPWEKTNRSIDKFNNSLDRHILKPVADGYVKVTPEPIRTALGHGFDNLTYFDTIFNDFLQGKALQGGSDTLRMLVNSTMGVGGLFDVATEMKLKHHDEDFGLTLGVWGVKPGRYIVVPFFGPSSGRDVWGIPVSVAADPLTWLDPYYIIMPIDALHVVDARAQATDVIRFRDNAALDPYAFTRHAYLAHREYQVRGGAATTQPAPPAIDYNLDDTAEPATQPGRTGPSTIPTAP